MEWADVLKDVEVIGGNFAAVEKVEDGHKSVAVEGNGEVARVDIIGLKIRLVRGCLEEWVVKQPIDW